MRYVFLTLLIFSSFIAASQNSLSDGINAFNNGNYEEAEKVLSEVMKNPNSLKEKDRANGWYFLGKSKSFLISNAMSVQSPDVLSKYKGFDLDAYNCFKKVLESPGGKKLKSSVEKEIENISYVLFNSGNTYYLLGESSPALKYYNSAAEIAETYGMKDDYQVYNLRGQTLLTVGDSIKAYTDFSKAIKHYEMKSSEIPDASIGYAYYFQAVIDLYSNNNIDKALKQVQSGTKLIEKESDRLNALIQNPGDLSLPMMGAQEKQFANISDALSRLELDIYRNYPEKYTEAIAKFEASLKENPNDDNLWLVYGNMIETKDMDAAYDAYKKAIDINPKNGVAQFNAGANRVNKGADYARKANEEFDFSKAQKWQDMVNEEFKSALPHLEKAHELEPENVYIIEALLQVTIQLEMMEDYKTYKAKKKKLTGY